MSSSCLYQFYSCIVKKYSLNLKIIFFESQNIKFFIYFKGLIPFHDTWSWWNSKEHGIDIIPALKDSLKRLPYKGSASSPGAKKSASFLVIQGTKTLLLLGINSFNSMRCFWPLFVTVSGKRATFSLIQVVFLTST